MSIKRNHFFKLLVAVAFLAIISFSPSVSAVDVSTADEFKAAAENGVTDFNIIADFDITPLKQNGKPITLDFSGATINLNGHTISSDNSCVYMQGTNFTIKNGNFDSIGGSYGLFIGDSETSNNVLIENVNISGGLNVYNSTNVILQNVNIAVTEAIPNPGNRYYAIWCDANAHITVKSGNYSSIGTAVIGMSKNESSLDIEGGTFTTHGNPLVLQGNFNIPVITGGTFNVEVDQKYCAEGYGSIQLGENVYSVVCKHANTTIKDKTEPTCTATGYTGNTYCTTCNKLLKNGENIPALGHNFSENWKFDKTNHWKECEKCSEIMPNTKSAHKFGTNSKCETCNYEDANQSLKDDQTNIKLDFKDSVLEDNTILKVIPVSNGTNYEDIKNVLPEVKDFISFDIYLLHNNVKVQPNGKILISIPIPDNFDKTKLAIYRIEGTNKIEYNGKVVKIDDKDYMQFETDHFSYYVLAEKNSTPTPAPTTPPADTTSSAQPEANTQGRKLDNEPKTGDNNSVLLAGILAIASLTGYVICQKKSVCEKYDKHKKI